MVLSSKKKSSICSLWQMSVLRAPDRAIRQQTQTWNPESRAHPREHPTQPETQKTCSHMSQGHVFFFLFFLYYSFFKFSSRGAPCKLITLVTIDEVKPLVSFTESIALEVWLPLLWALMCSSCVSLLIWVNCCHIIGEHGRAAKERYCIVPGVPAPGIQL